MFQKEGKYFCYGTRSVQEIVIIPFVSKMNEPERRSLLGLKLGNGLYSQCFDYIYDFVKCESELSSCESCLMNNAIKLAHIQRNANLDAFEDQYCDNCLNWDFNGATFKYHDNTYKSSKYLISKGLDIRNSEGEYIVQMHKTILFIIARVYQ